LNFFWLTSSRIVVVLAAGIITLARAAGTLQD